MTAPPRPTISMEERLRTPYEWTPRQRQVLDLMAAGRTNAEIGDALGISLDGAKWHVGEILSRLDAASREEAADYWRRYNGVAPRFARIFRAVSPLGALKVIGAAAVGAAIVAGLAIAGIVIWQGQDDDSAPAAPTSTATLAASPAAQPSATATATTTAPTPTTGSGAPTGPGTGDLRLAPAVESIPASVMFTVTGCWQCDGPDGQLRRHVTDASGAMKTTNIPEPLAATPGWSRGGYYASGDATLLLETACQRDYCGGLGPPLPSDTAWKVMASRDGGATWSEAFAHAGSYLAVHGAAVGAFTVSVAGEVPADNSPPAIEYFIVRPSGPQALIKPAGLDAYAYPVPLDDGSVTWLPQSGGLIDPATGDRVAINSGDIYLVGLAGPRLAIGNADRETVGLTTQVTAAFPVLVDLPGKTATPITADIFAQGGQNRFIAFRRGPFLAVTGAGDCLNVRADASPSAKVLTCLPDGALVGDAKRTVEAGGVTWAEVVLFSGEQGWASAQYLGAP